MIIAIITGEQGVAGITAFLDPGSALITFGGSFSVCLIMSANIKDYVKNLKSLSLIMKPIESNEEQVIKQIIDFS